MKYLVIGGEFRDEHFYYDTLEEAKKHNAPVIYLVEEVFVRERVTPEYQWISRELK